MYLEHFGLSAPPFQFTASPMGLFMSRTHREALAALEWGLLHEPSGLTLLVGDTGTGKTTLVCALLARQYREVRAAYLGNPTLSFMELMGSVLSQLGVRGGRANKAAMINAFSQFAADLPLTERIAILIDEAQALSDDTLEDFRLLSNLERHGRKAAQIILAGQYELARRLGDPAMRHFNERIGARAVLLTLSALESREYIEHRLSLCGASSKKIFAPRALEHIVRTSNGVPRRINALCHNSLLLVYSNGAKRVELATAKEAAADYAGLAEARKQDGREGCLLARLFQGARSLRPALALAVLGAAGFVSGQIMMNHNPLHHLRLWATHPSDSPYTAPVPQAKIQVGAAGHKRSSDLLLTTLDETPSGRNDRGSGSNFVEAGLSAPEALAAAAPKAVNALPPAAAPAPMVPAPAAQAAAAAPRAPAAPAAAAVPAKGRFVVVARGDTLGTIALRHLGSVYRVPRLLEVNPHITNASRIYPGEIVKLPPAIASSTGNFDDKDVE
jgi:general secretion pathway protein A